LTTGESFNAGWPIVGEYGWWEYGWWEYGWWEYGWWVQYAERR